MRRAAWVNQAVAAWLLGFVVIGLPDSATALEIATHGTIALLLLLASWRVLVARERPIAPVILQAIAGAALALVPVVFGYARSFLALHDVALGGAVVVDALIEIRSSVVREQLSAGRS